MTRINTRAAANLYAREGVWWLRIEIDGRQYRESLRTYDLDEAKLARDKRIGEIARGTGNRPRRESKSYVYFIQCGESFIKIGKANDPASRLVGMQVGTPFDLNLVHTVRGGLYVERGFHKKFSDYHHRGEWFWFEGELREWIENETRAAA